MTITAGQVIDEARDYHAALSKTNAPERIAWRELTSTMNRMRARIMVRVPSFMAEEETVELTSDVFENGIDIADFAPYGLKAFTGPIRFLYDASTPERYVNGLFVPWEQRGMNNAIPSYTLINNVIRLLSGNAGVGQLSTQYANFDSLTISYTANVTPIEGNDDVLTGFPDDAVEPLSLAVAALWIRRLVGSPQYGVRRADADYWDAKASDAENAFYTRITRGITQQQSYYIVDCGP